MDALKNELLGASESDYKKFSERITPTKYRILGIRLPWLKRKARELAKNGEDALLHIGAEFFEEIMLRGFVIAYIKTDISTRLGLVSEFLPLIDNWAVCDSFCAAMKDAQKHPEEMWAFINGLIFSENEFYVRFAAVMILDYFITEKYIDSIFDALSSIKHPGYYVRMAVAWAISVCCVKFRDKTMEYLKTDTLDDFTHNKAIQKCRESNRLSQEDKNTLNSLKR